MQRFAHFLNCCVRIINLGGFEKWYGQKRNECVRKHTHIKISLVGDKFLGRGACVHIVKLQNESCEDT